MKLIIVLAVALSILAGAQTPATAQDPFGGAILGGTAGAIVGGAITRRGEGALIGAIIGATAGAIIAREGIRNRRGYYAWQEGCYIQRRDRSWVRVAPRYCY